MLFRSLRHTLVGLALLTVFALTASSVAAAQDRLPPTKPGNLQVTGKTQTSVSLAWRASLDNSGNFSYRVNLWQASNSPVTLPKTQTSYTWAGLLPNVQYYFWVEAVDAAGNKSTSDLVTVTTDRDSTPPSTPANLRVTSVTASQVGLAWDASSDNTGIASYTVSIAPNQGAVTFTGPTSATIIGLAPSTQYSFAVSANDFGYNSSPFSSTVSATTLASTDTQPPTAPSNLRLQNWDCEVELTWTQSTDDQDPQAAIRYEIFINGTPDVIGPVRGVGRTITYGITAGENTFVLRAVDSAGNVSGPSNAVTRVLRC